MSRASRFSETLISVASAIVFFVLDILDVIMCVFFIFLDEFLEGKSSTCYCIGREEKKEDSNGADGENGLSETLYGRKNVFRDMGLLRISRFWNREGAFCVGKKGNRWSDCGCESCVSWMSNGSDFKLHVVVNEQEKELLICYQLFFLMSKLRIIHLIKADFITLLHDSKTLGQAGEQPRRNDRAKCNIIHGFMSSSSLWKETVFPNLSEHSTQNYKLFAVDLLGFGRSPKPRDCFYTLRDHLEMIEKSVILPFQVNSFHLVAHSMGCVIALALAAKYSKSVKSITLIAPPYFSSSKGDASTEALRRLATRRMRVFLYMPEPQNMGMDFKATYEKKWGEILGQILGNFDGCRVKIRVIQGTKDQVVPVECSFNMKMEAPQIELEIIPNADHNTVFLDRAKDFTRDLESLWASTDKKIVEHTDVRQEMQTIC
ncbi:hypothetical protein DH2020_014054 [Rehmannia glutinosa]|uniref:AB hydrolase-1 domain-containing protein n=1 Tax=Rehmannia glutinosa TaxID=99300 RepID=A0ABR0WW73_REHGL